MQRNGAATIKKPRQACMYKIVHTAGNGEALKPAPRLGL
jgi:hypothetical protein